MFRRARPAAAEKLTDAIDRIMPMLRFFRLGDGKLARFNGCGATATDALATVLAYDDIEGTPVRAARELRLCADRLRRRRSSSATSGRRRLPRSACRACRVSLFRDELGEFPIVVNCGAPGVDHDEWRRFSRSTQRNRPRASKTHRRRSSPASRKRRLRRCDADRPANVQASLSANRATISASKARMADMLSRFGIGHARRIESRRTGSAHHGEDKLGASRGLKSPKG